MNLALIRPKRNPIRLKRNLGSGSDSAANRATGRGRTGGMTEENRWIVAAMRSFSRVWRLMTPENRGRLLRVLVSEVRVDEVNRVAEVELIDFAGESDPEEAA